MLFNSIEFLIFLPIVLLITFVVPKKIRYLWLLISSYYFYMCWNPGYVLLILFSTLVTYLGGLGVQWCKEKDWEECKIIRTKKLFVSLGVVLNIGVLCYFKYTNFMLENIRNLFAVVGIEVKIPKVDILLPVGISFFTFQALGYLIDVYRDDIYAEKNFFRYALFVSFFPQLVAGPIERSKSLLKQLASPAQFHLEKAVEAIWMMLYGYFLKVVLADRIAIFVDTAYGNYHTYNGVYLLVACFFFIFQIYCDFYGYSVIARGTALLFGYELMDNFNAPFFSKSISELWRRWHISLNSWFRDYLYIPMGGNRKGTIRKNINMLFVFAVSGLWHGADWTYMIWGLLNGIYQILGKVLMPVRDLGVRFLHLDRNSISHKVMKRVVVVLLFAFSMIFFRAQNMKQALEIIASLFKDFNPWILFNEELYTCGLERKNFTLVLWGIFVLLFADYQKYKGITIRDVIMKQEWWFRYLFMAGSIVLIVLLGIWGTGYNEASFIYFQF